MIVTKSLKVLAFKHKNSKKNEHIYESMVFQFIIRFGGKKCSSTTKKEPNIPEVFTKCLEAQNANTPGEIMSSSSDIPQR